MPTPKISVLMCAYNSAWSIREAVKSILNQTFKQFELIVVNDGSRDDTQQSIKSFMDERVRVIHKEKNEGQSAALNDGLSEARGKYIAIMDSDDVSLPNRLMRQISYLEKHPSMGVVGTGQTIVNKRGHVLDSQLFPQNPGFIGWSIILGGWCLSHPTVMMRRRVIRRHSGYLKNAFVSQDYDLWSRILFDAKITNIPEILLQKRSWGGMMTLSDANLDRAIVVKAMQRAIENILNEKVDRKIIERLFWLEKYSILKEMRSPAAEYRKMSSYLRRQGEGIEFNNYRQIRGPGLVIQKLYKAYQRRFRLTKEERMEITPHALGKLHLLAVFAAKISASRVQRNTLYAL